MEDLSVLNISGVARRPGPCVLLQGRSVIRTAAIHYRPGSSTQQAAAQSGQDQAHDLSREAPQSLPDGEGHDEELEEKVGGEVGSPP